VDVTIKLIKDCSASLAEAALLFYKNYWKLFVAASCDVLRV
jgi:hypothetical protein